MKRSHRAECAKQTVEICERGGYIAPSGKSISIKQQVQDAIQGTVFYTQENVSFPGPTVRCETRISVVNETTFNAVSRLFAAGHDHIACLNFASAKNAGGGFLNGAQAQEEALARASALYPCLLSQPAYYERNRGNRSALYLDLAIYSPKVPFFRNDAGELLESPVLASVITAPAPNAGAVMANESGNASLIEPTFKRRAEMVLAIAAANGVQHLVLGAWGCGVFRNDPAMVASIFKDLLNGERFRGVFLQVIFAVFDTSETRSTFEAFRKIV